MGRTNEDGLRAFPISAEDFYDRGMLLRDYFAAAAVTGILAIHADSEADSPNPATVADFAYQVADAMMRRRG